MSEADHDMTAGPTRRDSPMLALLSLALPMIGMTVSRMLMGFIDFAMVSQLGTAAQAAISPATLLLFTLACIGMGVTQGVQTFVAQAEGRGEPHRAGTYVWQTQHLAVLVAAATAPLAWLTPWWFPWLAALGHHPPDVEAMEVAFLRIALWSVGPMTACAGLESFYNGIRRPGIGLAAVLVSLGTIALGNYALIFGHFGLPALGIAGSGVATVLAWTVRLAVLLGPLTWRSIDERYRTLRGMGLRRGAMGDLVRVGAPIAAQWLVDIGAWVVFLQVMLPRFGPVAMAASSLGIQYMHLSFMPAVGVGIALTTQVGNAIGAGRFDEAELRVRVARRVILGYMGLMGVVFVLAGGPLAGLLCFEPDPVRHSAVIQAAARVLVWAALFQLSDGLCIVYSFALRGAGDTRVPALLFALCCWLIFVAGGLTVAVAAPRWGADGPWLMCTAYIVVLSVLLWRRFHSAAWRRIRLWERAEPAGGALGVQAGAAGAPAGATE